VASSALSIFSKSDSRWTVMAGNKGGSRLFSDFARIAISAAGEQDFEGRFSL
jgi:hypothetical protein